MIGRKTDKYKSLQAPPIGHGGFGKVYRISDKLVVKEEHTVCSDINTTYIAIGIFSRYVKNSLFL